MRLRPITTLALLLTGCRSPAAVNAITVSVAASLQNAMEDIKTLYVKGHPGTAITFNFGSSGALARQIEQGAPADAFISAAPKPMDELESQGLLLAGTRRDLLRNRLVLIAPQGNSSPASFRDLTLPAVKVIAIGDPDSVPAGDYARQVLTAFGIWDAVRPKLVLARDVRQVLSYVETGNADAGIVYSTDARQSGRVHVVETAPEGSHSAVLYPVSVLKTTKNERLTRDFVSFLTGFEAQKVFSGYGFSHAPLDLH